MLNPFYATQFVHNESTAIDSGNFKCLTYNLGHVPVVKGTITGTVYLMENGQYKAIQTFATPPSGHVVFQNIYPNLPKRIECGSINCITGEAVFHWNDFPGYSYLVLSYEYEMETNQAVEQTKASKYRSIDDSWGW